MTIIKLYADILFFDKIPHKQDFYIFSKKNNCIILFINKIINNCIMEKYKFLSMTLHKDSSTFFKLIIFANDY